jgi:hypothetical protein
MKRRKPGQIFGSSEQLSSLRNEVGVLVAFVCI